MSRINVETLLDRYLKGETSKDENKHIEKWLEENDNPGTRWLSMDSNDKDQWLSGIFNDIQESKNKSKVVVLLPRRRNWKAIVAIAATITVILGLYFKLPVFRNNLNPLQFTAMNVPIHQKKELILADGSKVWINESSELKYPKEFSGQIREVYLSGEAYFDIKHDPSKPFIIHTGKITTTVLGTAFNIKEDPELHTVVVTVTRGKVGVANGNKQLGIITPNQQISFNLSDQKAVQTLVDASQVIAWKEKDLHFDNITFAEAAAQLQQRFHIKISFTNEKLKNCQFTGTALNGEKLDKILKVICIFNNATYKKDTDGNILIDGQGCN